MEINSVGLKIGHAQDVDAYTGCSVFLCPEGSVVSSDVRGMAPGSRESALLRPEKPTSDINAVLLTGGSAFGLAAADGVMQWLSDHDIGHWTPVRKIPLVPAAVVYDLFFSMGKVTPDAAMGRAACDAAFENNAAQGNVGAGAGVTVGKWGGFPGFMKGGLGLASTTVRGASVFAAAVVNAVGDVVADDGTMLAGAVKEDGSWRVMENPYRLSAPRPTVTISNTTLVVVATDVKLTKVECNRLAQRAHDGMAMAIRPIHTTHDGDTAFGISTGQVEAPFDWVANIGAELVATAIRNAVHTAQSVNGIRGLASG
ncbi:MAG: P1 family peptidase [Candidatus Promineifilaceae bacterium]